MKVKWFDKKDIEKVLKKWIDKVLPDHKNKNWIFWFLCKRKLECKK